MNAPGWYPDPLGGPAARYWDGTRWDGATQAAAPPPPHEEFPEPPSPPKSRPVWPLWVGLAVAACVAVAAVTFAVTRPKSESSNLIPAEVQKPTLSVAAEPPTLSPAEIAAASVKVSMQQKLDSDPDMKDLGLHVAKVVLVNKSGNEFKGIATVKTRDGEEHEVPIEVTDDGDNTLWEAPPGAFLFAVPDRPPPPPPRAPEPAAAPGVENFTICPSGLSGVATDETSCAFADSVRLSWYSQPGNIITAYSPVTHQSYTMQCAPSATTVWSNAKRCSGVNSQGTLLVVYIE